MEQQELYHRIECMLFVSGEAVPLTELARVLSLSVDDTRSVLKSMEESYREEGRGMFPLVTDETCQIVSNPAYRADIEELLQPEKTKNVSKSIMETLSVIAYRQPCTRADIEAVRGVRCEYAVSQLLKLGLITEAGRKEVVGRPVLFATTDHFLRKLGIHSLEELPEFPDLSTEELPGDASDAE